MSDPREELYCLPFVPIGNIGSKEGYVLFKRLHRWKKPASAAKWDDSEIREICLQLSIPLPRHMQVVEEVPF